jgi:hypothetical protein
MEVIGGVVARVGFSNSREETESEERGAKEALQLPHTTVAVSLLHPFYHTCVFPPEDSIAQ